MPESSDDEEDSASFESTGLGSFAGAFFRRFVGLTPLSARALLVPWSLEVMKLAGSSSKGDPETLARSYQRNIIWRVESGKQSMFCKVVPIRSRVNISLQLQCMLSGSPLSRAKRRTVNA